MRKIKTQITTETMQRTASIAWHDNRLMYVSIPNEIDRFKFGTLIKQPSSALRCFAIRLSRNLVLVFSCAMRSPSATQEPVLRLAVNIQFWRYGVRCICASSLEKWRRGVALANASCGEGEQKRHVAQRGAAREEVEWLCGIPEGTEQTHCRVPESALLYMLLCALNFDCQQHNQESPESLRNPEAMHRATRHWSQIWNLAGETKKPSVVISLHSCSAAGICVNFSFLFSITRP